MALKDLQAPLRRASLARTPVRIDELWRLQRHNGCETMADFWIVNGWYRTGPDGEVAFTRPRWSMETAIKAIRLLVRLEGIKPTEVTFKLLAENGLKQAIIKLFDGKAFNAIRASFPERDYRQWEMKMIPPHFFDSKENRVEAVRWLVEVRLKINPSELSKRDLHENGLAGLLLICKGSPYRAVKEAYPWIKPSDMKRMPVGTKPSREDLAELVRGKAAELGIEPRDLCRRDIPPAILEKCGNRLYTLLSAAGIAKEGDEEYIRRRGTRTSAKVRAAKAAARRDVNRPVEEIAGGEI